MALWASIVCADLQCSTVYTINLLQVHEINVLDEAAMETCRVWLEDSDAGLTLDTSLLEARDLQGGVLVVPTTNLKAAAQQQQGPRREFKFSQSCQCSC